MLIDPSSRIGRVAREKAHKVSRAQEATQTKSSEPAFFTNKIGQCYV